MRKSLPLLFLLLCSTVWSQGILPSWMRRGDDTQTEVRTETRTEIRTIEVKQSPPEILNLSVAKSPFDSSIVIVSGEVKTEGNIHEVLLNGERISSASGAFKVELKPKIGKNEYSVEATDTRGLKTALSVSYTHKDSSTASVATLHPETLVHPKKYEDAVALIVGIENYPNQAPSTYSVKDAQMFKQYASTALKVPSNRIKMITNEEATRVGILRSIDFWLRSEVTANTRVYFYYSGHGLASSDGETTYVVPFDGDSLYLSETAISLENLFKRIEATKPKELVAFLDSCYAGQSRAGKTLVADARPIALKVKQKVASENATVFMAASGSELANSDPSKQHGLFSFYLMKGLEGIADSNKDGKISSNELFAYTKQNTFKDSVKNLQRPQNPEVYGKVIDLTRH